MKLTQMNKKQSDVDFILTCSPWEIQRHEYIITQRMKIKYRLKGPIGRPISLNQPNETKNLDFLNSLASITKQIEHFFFFFDKQIEN